MPVVYPNPFSKIGTLTGLKRCPFTLDTLAVAKGENSAIPYRTGLAQRRGRNLGEAINQSSERTTSANRSTYEQWKKSAHKIIRPGTFVREKLYFFCTLKCIRRQNTGDLQLRTIQSSSASQNISFFNSMSVTSQFLTGDNSSRQRRGTVAKNGIRVNSIPVL